ncbi:unnamed protein product [Acanthoscelides obtectus]|uniref:Uncharacterized protein n=1 Tax=Acanthoscelides obtectus TaxID=200917 RepID=A0A9P0L511_ACAOB|nr:unnamed protein product [Acanthoscelides obtectus]CAK1677884.1 hypothetical protein AOBTE_LOCUS31616 [Acanthoscelides obtectus]
MYPEKNEAKSNDDDRGNNASIIPESPENADTVNIQQTTEANGEQGVAPDNRAQLKKKEFVSPKQLPTKNKKKFTNDSDERAEMTFQYLQTKMQEGRKEIDECIAFGNLIAAKLKNMDLITRQHAMNDINNIMFRASIRPHFMLQSESFSPLASSSSSPSPTFLVESPQSSPSLPLPPQCLQPLIITSQSDSTLTTFG